MDGSTEDELGTDRLFEFPLELVQVTGLRAELYDDGDRRIDRQSASWQPDLEFTGDARAEGGNNVSDRTGEDVHAADDKHVIDTTDAADPDPSTAAFTSPYSLNSDEITNSEANQRDTLALDCRVDEFSEHPFLRLDRMTGLGFDELGDHEALSDEVHAGLCFALRPKDRCEVCSSHRVVDLAAPGFLDLLADLGNTSSRLATQRHRFDAERGRINPEPLAGNMSEEVDESGARDHVVDPGPLDHIEGSRGLHRAGRIDSSLDRAKCLVEAQPGDVPA